ncbi:MCE family protein [Rhodococcus triatomae]|uniref:Phospholipid/cholesterol/gamma-HCH transport system substrate-binding protein n=1 Tax=Rhodococcus triatomae TaxID=300028 RepID=A0A1G8B907_9NOCA|nr:MCE family protein [Rhodococcus triatomae]QNG17531.1 MCE family protein [Rhodococcus triatomae]QNG22801.1 MCE family protein [Rhodococcus triatomae]SDH29675.1 phospholipid/cholesterol/gamma-HCH transport system substrate-binding protein [Rhodococcus triatomae]
MKTPRDPVQVGIIGLVVAGATVVAGLQYDQLQFLTGGSTYSAYFEDAGGLTGGDTVTLAGVDVGKVSEIALADTEVLVRFSVQDGIRLGTDTEVAIKTNTVLGRKSLEVTPRGNGTLKVGDQIPSERTNSPYSLNDALGDLTTTVGELDTDRVNDALDAVSGALTDTPPELRAALDGVTRLSQSINARDETLQQLLARAESVTGILAERSDQINALILDGNELFGELDRRRTAISELIVNVSAVSRQLSGLVQDNQEQMKPTLDSLNSVVSILQENNDNISQALDGLAPYATQLGEAVGSGPFFMAFVYNIGLGKLFQGLSDAVTWPEHLPADLESYLTPPPSIELKDPNR